MISVFGMPLSHVMKAQKAFGKYTQLEIPHCVHQMITFLDREGCPF